MLDDELRAFQSEREELLEQHEGQFVAYAGQTRIGVFDSYVAAATAAAGQGRKNVLVREIRKEEPVYFVPSVIRVE